MNSLSIGWKVLFKASSYGGDNIADVLRKHDPRRVSEQTNGFNGLQRCGSVAVQPPHQHLGTGFLTIQIEEQFVPELVSQFTQRFDASNLLRLKLQRISKGAIE